MTKTKRSLMMSCMMVPLDLRIDRQTDTWSRYHAAALILVYAYLPLVA